MFNTILTNCSNFCCGPIHLRGGNPENNVNHLATLQADKRERSALLPNSKNLAEVGGTPSIANEVSALWSGICWATKAVAGTVLIASAKLAKETGIFNEDNQFFCAKVMTSVVVNTGATAFTNLFSSSPQSVPSGEEIKSYANLCKEAPNLVKVLVSIRDGAQSLAPYKELLFVSATVIGIFGAIYNLKSRESTQQAAKANLFNELSREYGQGASHLTARFKKAELENNASEIAACRSLATKINENIPLIERQLDKCSPCLTVNQIDAIVGKLKQACVEVLR